MAKIRRYAAMPLALSFASTGAPPPTAFDGDFAALALTYGLTVRGDYGGDAGASGSLGTGFASLANRFGTASALTGADTNGLLATAGLGGKAGFATGATQRGTYTMPAQAAPGTTNIHRWWIGRILSTPASGAGSVFNDSTGANAVQIVAGQTSPAANLWIYNNAAGPTTAGVVINTWYRFRASLTGGANDQIRVGAHAPAASATSNTAPTTARTLGSDAGGGNRSAIEYLRLMEIEGALSNFLAFDADAGPKAQSFWTNAIEI